MTSSSLKGFIILTQRCISIHLSLYELLLLRGLKGSRLVRLRDVVFFRADHRMAGVDRIKMAMVKRAETTHQKQMACKMKTST